MLGNDFFYNRTIRKIVVAFGTALNDIHIVRFATDGTPKESFKVPLSYGSKEKYITRLQSDPDLTKSISVAVPRISFELTGMTYDASRKLITTGRNFAANNSTSVKAQYNPVPYDFEFNVSIYVRNTEDGTQILEQILPFFTPDFNVTVDFVHQMGRKYDMPIILNSVTTNTEYEGDMTSTRFITWDLTFTTKAYLWPPVKSAEIIRSANTNIWIETKDKAKQTVFIDLPTGHGTFLESELVFVKQRNISGKVIKTTTNSAGELVIGELNNFVETGDKLEGITSGAAYTVYRTDPAPIKAVDIMTRPNPITAEPDDEFGFAETFTYWPSTS